MDGLEDGKFIVKSGGGHLEKNQDHRYYTFCCSLLVISRFLDEIFLSPHLLLRVSSKKYNTYGLDFWHSVVSSVFIILFQISLKTIDNNQRYSENSIFLPSGPTVGWVAIKSGGGAKE